MVIIDLDKCLGCGTCTAFCPREALEAWWGHAEVNTEKCTDCFGGHFLFAPGVAFGDKPPSTIKKGCEWGRLCVQYCPVEAIKVVEDTAAPGRKKARPKARIAA